jgi:hypothetical protein
VSEGLLKTVSRMNEKPHRKELGGVGLEFDMCLWNFNVSARVYEVFLHLNKQWLGQKQQKLKFQ